jgi:calcineurin-like phosphoesterase family protein
MEKPIGYFMLNQLKFKSADQQIWFTSDCHFNHDKPFIYNRRFGCDSREEYTELLIYLWNEAIKPTDIVFDLGDFIFQDGTGQKAWSILSRLNGIHYLLWGNHNSGVKSVFGDQEHYPYKILDKVIFVDHYVEIVIDKQGIILCHYPIASWNDMMHGTWMLHGHSHGTFPDEQFGKMLDVGQDLFPGLVTYEGVKSILDKREPKQLDFHTQNTNQSGEW